MLQIYFQSGEFIASSNDWPTKLIPVFSVLLGAFIAFASTFLIEFIRNRKKTKQQKHFLKIVLSDLVILIDNQVEL